MARKFLYVIAGLIAFVLVAGAIWQLYSRQLMQMALVPKEQFKPPPPIAPRIYADAQMWIARPDIANNPSSYTPEGLIETAEKASYATFFIHPTSYLERAHWNAPLDDKEANDRAALFVRGQASVFNKSGKVWAPRYRQATYGAFLTDAPEARQALDVAYSDISTAFDEFLVQNPKGPIILAGHSQGSLHLSRLLQDKVAGKPVAKRIIAAYVVGWPIGEAADLPALGLPACATATQTGCILSWQSFAEPASYGEILSMFRSAPGLAGGSRLDDKLLCTNPLTGTVGANAPTDGNEGTLKNEPDFSGGTLIAKTVPARCDAQGFLLIGDGPKLGPYVLPGNNYHVYDYSLFWRNIRSDVVRRAQAFGH
jgi:Protein of unknown function (DUF3089)